MGIRECPYCTPKEETHITLLSLTFLKWVISRLKRAEKNFMILWPPPPKKKIDTVFALCSEKKKIGLIFSIFTELYPEGWRMYQLWE